MKLLLDEMYSATVAEQLRARRHDVVSIHDAEFRSLEGAPDEEVFAAAIAEERAIVTENVPDFRRLEADALASDAPTPRLIFTTNRQFPRVIPPPSDDSFSRSMLCSPNARPVAQRTSSSRCLPPDPEAGCH